MAVVIADIRAELNDITVEELADATIQRKIDNADEKAVSYGITDPTEFDRFVRAWAAYYSFIVSRSYKLVEVLDIEVQRDLKLIANALKKNAEDIEEEILGAEVDIIESTPMWDDRPYDPNLEDC